MDACGIRKEFGKTHFLEVLNQAVLNFAARMRPIVRNLKSIEDADISSVDPSDILSGLRGKTLLWHEGSTVDPIHGLLIHGLDVSTLANTLPSSQHAGVRSEPYIEGIIFLLLSGQKPLQSDVQVIHSLLDTQSSLLELAQNAIGALDPTSPVLSMVSAGLLALQTSSVFRKHQANQGARTEQYKYCLQDVLTIWSVMPALCGFVLQRRRESRDRQHSAPTVNNAFAIPQSNPVLTGSSNCSANDYGASIAKHLFGIDITPSKDFEHNFNFKSVNTLEADTPSVSPQNTSQNSHISDIDQICLVIDFCRLYVRLHCDHGGGNASAHASHLLGSAGANPFASLAASMLALEAPLHGGANSEAVVWLHRMRTVLSQHSKRPDDNLFINHAKIPHFEKDANALMIPNAEDITAYALQQLRTKRSVIPGYGHAVLRAVDPRATALVAFAQKYSLLRSHPSVKLATIAPPAITEALKAIGKAKSPYPNVDAVSGLILEAVLDVSKHAETCRNAFYHVLPKPMQMSASRDSYASSTANNSQEINELSARLQACRSGDGRDDSHIQDLEDIGLLLFAISRAIGAGAQLVLDRVLEMPLERPGSKTLQEMLDLQLRRSGQADSIKAMSQYKKSKL